MTANYKKFSLMIAVCMMLGTNASEAALILTWEQVGNDVKATWSGTYLVPFAGSGTISPFVGAAITNSDRLQGFGEASVRSIYPNQGTASATGLLWTEDPWGPAHPRGTYVGDSFGFWGNGGGSLIFKEGAQGTLFAPVGTFTFANTTLAALGADSFNNTLAWTGANNVGDSSQVFYQTYAAPEPSSVASTALLGLTAILLHQRRRNVGTGLT